MVDGRWLMAGLMVARLVAAEEVPAPAREWEYIVIHHSATESGSAALFHVHHQARGMVNGLAYHFVIDNGTAGTRDGFIETGERWVKQLHGGHCRQQEINERGIGVCLVGDFTRRQPTPKQMDSLILLVRGLQEQFQVAHGNIVGHGQVLGEFSECPGQSFPWEELRKRLQEPAP